MKQITAAERDTLPPPGRVSMSATPLAAYGLSSGRCRIEGKVVDLFEYLNPSHIAPRASTVSTTSPRGPQSVLNNFRTWPSPCTEWVPFI